MTFDHDRALNIGYSRISYRLTGAWRRSLMESRLLLWKAWAGGIQWDNVPFEVPCYFDVFVSVADLSLLEKYRT